jgi:tetratricopeptide (TPR) repeat protein
MISCASSRKLTTTPVSAKPLSEEAQLKYDYFFREAVRLQALGKHAEAFDLYKYSLSINPNAASALFRIASYYMGTELAPPAEELKVLKQAVANAPDNYWYNVGLSSAYLRNNQIDNAISLLEDMLKRFPKKDDPYFTLLRLYEQKQDYPKVIGMLNRIEQRTGKTEQISMEKFRIYVQINNKAKAFNEIDSLVAQYPLDMRYKVLQGDMNLQYGDKGKAKQIYDEVLSREPGNPQAELSLANYYDAVSDTVNYYRQLDTVLLNKDVTPDVKVSLIRRYVASLGKTPEDSTKVNDMFERIIAEDNEDTQIPMMYASYLMEQQKGDKAVSVLQHILQLDPSNTVARMNLLSIAVPKEDYKEIIRICKPGTEVTPQVIEFHFYLGIAYYQLGEYDLALKAYQAALKNVKPDTDKKILSDIYSMLGDIHHSLGKDSLAYAAYDSALVYNSENIPALNNYAYYLSLKSVNLDKAEAMSYKTVRAEPKNSTYLDTYAWILFEKGEYTRAALFITQALVNGGEESDVIVEHAGDIYYKNGDKAEALKRWKQAKSMGSKSKTLDMKIKKEEYIAGKEEQ